MRERGEVAKQGGARNCTEETVTKTQERTCNKQLNKGNSGGSKLYPSLRGRSWHLVHSHSLVPPPLFATPLPPGLQFHSKKAWVGPRWRGLILAAINHSALSMPGKPERRHSKFLCKGKRRAQEITALYLLYTSIGMPIRNKSNDSFSVLKWVEDFIFFQKSWPTLQ